MTLRTPEAVRNEVVWRANKLLGDSRGSLQVGDFYLMQWNTVQVYSDNLNRVILFYRFDNRTFRKLHDVRLETENNIELMLALEQLQRAMVLDDLASIPDRPLPGRKE